MFDNFLNQSTKTFKLAATVAAILLLLGIGFTVWMVYMLASTGAPGWTMLVVIGFMSAWTGLGAYFLRVYLNKLKKAEQLEIALEKAREAPPKSVFIQAPAPAISDSDKYRHVRDLRDEGLLSDEEFEIMASTLHKKQP